MSSEENIDLLDEPSIMYKMSVRLREEILQYPAGQYSIIVIGHDGDTYSGSHNKQEIYEIASHPYVCMLSLVDHAT